MRETHWILTVQEKDDTKAAAPEESTVRDKLKPEMLRQTWEVQVMQMNISSLKSGFWLAW